MILAVNKETRHLLVSLFKKSHMEILKRQQDTFQFYLIYT